MPAELGQKSFDLEAYLLGWMGYREKKLLANVQTQLQQVQIYQALLILESGPLFATGGTGTGANGDNKLTFF